MITTYDSSDASIRISNGDYQAQISSKMGHPTGAAKSDSRRHARSVRGPFRQLAQCISSTIIPKFSQKAIQVATTVSLATLLYSGNMI